MPVRTLFGRLHFVSRLVRNSLLLRDWQYGQIITKAKISPAGVSVTPDGLWVDELNVSIPRDSSSLIFNLADALLLKRAFGVKFHNSPEGIIAETRSFRVLITTAESLYVLREILNEGVYNFGSPPADIVVWDIGMNLAMASLYFAARPYVRSVIGFEPFRPNFLGAQRNLALNPELKPKIQIHNYGVAGGACTAELEFHPECNANVGLAGIPSHLKSRFRDSAPSSLEHVEMLGADAVLESILADHPTCRVVAKIDCEGSEYEILRCLQENELLRRLSMIILEWHQRGPAELDELLHRAGFATYSPSSGRGPTGMLYAVNTFWDWQERQ